VNAFSAAPATEAPLTEAQAGLWFAQALDPANPVFNTGQVIDLRGALDRDAFAAAVNGAVAEADALALRIRPGPDGAVQAVDEARRPWLEVVDLSAAADPEAEARAAMARDMATAHAALAAERLYVLGPERHFWFQRVHHLAVDAFGTDLLVRRVAALYAGGGGPALAPLSAALAADADYRAGPKRAADAAFWHAELAELPEVRGLAPGEARSGHAALRHALPLPGSLSAALRGAAERHALPWPDLLAVLVAGYVRRFAGGAESCIGLTFMGRLGSPAARVPCTLMNVLPLRLRAPEATPLPALLADMGALLRQVRRHGRFRGEQLRRDLGLLGAGRRLHGPLVNLLPFGAAPAFAGLHSTLEVLGTGPVDDLTLTFRAAPDAAGLHLLAEANSALYDTATLAAHAARLAWFCEAALAANSLAEVPSATPAEAGWALHRLNDTAHDLPDTTLAALIEARMRRTPDAPAVEAAGVVLSYAELDRQSAALAGLLRARGAGPGRCVAVALDRSTALLVALVAVLRAGAAFLPLDPAHPAPRLAAMLADAAPVLLLAEAPLPGGTPLLPPGEWPAQGAAPPDGPAPADPAYLLYTSGSTGTPKGVVVGHRAICNRLEWMRAHYGFGPADRILQKTPATFDVSVWEFFLSFLGGGTLVMAPPGAHRDPAALAALIRDNGITAAHFVPSMLDAFLAEPSAKGLSLARVFCSGEELTPELRDRFHATISAELHNLYGPTEAAVDVSFHDAGPEDRARPVPIGRPVWNTRLYVLDDALRPVPPGMAGALFIAGVQLAEGYLNRPDLTAAAFIPDPFHPGQRMYRTGDRARLRPDGAIVYLGRADQQVKIRGQRIELGEVEAALAGTPGVAQCRVVAREGRLVAYAVPGPGFDAALLRARAEQLLPAAMRPAAYVSLPALPVNSSGKLDRAALPAPGIAPAGGRPPATDTERQLAALFGEVLGTAGVGAEDDFFSLGGHSLLAVRLLRRVRETLGWDPGLGAVFAHSSVARLAALLDRRPAGAHGLDPVVTLAEGDAALAPVFAIHPAGGLSWCYGGLARALAPRRTLHGLQAPALDPAAAPPASLDDLAEDYATRIAALRPAGVLHLLGWSVGGIIAHAVARHLRTRGRTVGLLAMLDSYPSDVWRAEPEPDENAPLRALLAIGGFDPDRLPDLPLTRAAVTAFLRAGDSPLGQLPEAALDGVVRVVRGNNPLVRAHRHGRYDGTVTHFHAALDHHAGRAVSPAMWRPYAAAVEVVEIPALHADLTGAAATAHVAPVLAARLARFDRDG